MVLKSSGSVILGNRRKEKKIPARGMFPGAAVQHKKTGVKGKLKKWVQKFPEIVQIEDERGEKVNLPLMENNEVTLFVLFQQCMINNLVFQKQMFK